MGIWGVFKSPDYGAMGYNKYMKIPNWFMWLLGLDFVIIGIMLYLDIQRSVNY
jgi:putative effector of murein hydrolase